MSANSRPESNYLIASFPKVAVECIQCVLWLSVAHKTVDPRGSGGSYSNAIKAASIFAINDAHTAPKDLDMFIKGKRGDDMSTPTPSTCEGTIRAISCFSVVVSSSIIKSNPDLRFSTMI